MESLKIFLEQPEFLNCEGGNGVIGQASLFNHTVVTQFL